MNNITDFVLACQADMLANGVPCEEELILDGEIHRYSCDENLFKADEWYAGIVGITSDSKKYLICNYGSWSTGINFTYKSYEALHNSSSDYEMKKIRNEAREHSIRLKSEQETKEKLKHNKVAKLLLGEYRKMNLLPHSGQKIEDYIRSAHKYLWYLDMKRIKQYECDSWPIKFSEYYDKATDSLCPSIVIPLINIENKIRSVEYIYNAKGICRKQFKKGGEKRGNFYPLDGLGRFYSPDKSSFSHSLKGTHVVKQLYIAEGYATAASLFESLQDMSFDDNRLSFNYHMIVAFDASNICPVVGNLRTKFPTQEIIICADDDEIGHKAANKACQMYNCRKFIT